MLSQLKFDLKKASDPKKAQLLQGFFKTGKGEYGEGDIFIGVIVPETRKIAVKYKYMPLKDIETLLKSSIHEERLCALLMLVHNYEHGDEKTRQIIYDFYIKNTKHINNWDLVDLSCPRIVGQHILHKDRAILYHLARSKDLWEKRISIISTFYLIKNSQYSDSLALANILLNDSHDLIHKAVGWMLREIGKKDMSAEEAFLRKNYKKMPRTMLRYAIEKFPEKLRKEYLSGKI